MDPNAEKYLLALYAEAHNKRPQLANVAAELGLSGAKLGRAVNALYVAGLVGSVVVQFGDDDVKPVSVTTDGILLTRRGARYIEEKLALAPTTPPRQKLHKIIAAAGGPDWAPVKAIAERALGDGGGA